MCLEAAGRADGEGLVKYRGANLAQDSVSRGQYHFLNPQDALTFRFSRVFCWSRSYSLAQSGCLTFWFL